MQVARMIYHLNTRTVRGAKALDILIMDGTSLR